MKRWILPLLLTGVLAIAAQTININDVYVFQTLFRPWTRTTTQLAALTPSVWTGYAAYDTTKGALSTSNGTAWISSPYAGYTPVTGRACAARADAGAVDLPDGGYTYRVLH